MESEPPRSTIGVAPREAHVCHPPFDSRLAGAAACGAGASVRITAVSGVAPHLCRASRFLGVRREASRGASTKGGAQAGLFAGAVLVAVRRSLISGSHVWSDLHDIFSRQSLRLPFVGSSADRTLVRRPRLRRQFALRPPLPRALPFVSRPPIAAARRAIRCVPPSRSRQLAARVTDY
jgi:hypothetical protein